MGGKRVQIGRKFGRLTVLRRGPATGKSSYICSCECGNEPIIHSSNLHNGSSKSCGCLALETRRSRPFEALFNKMRRTVLRRGKAFDLSYEDFLSFTDSLNCHYCNAPIYWQSHSRYGLLGPPYNLDCKNPNEGYTLQNLVVCCRVCNMTKRNEFSYEEFLRIGAVIRGMRYSGTDATASIQTFTGRRFFPLAPRINDIVIEDIAHALSLLCRFTGHVREYYSVAEHSVRVSYLVPTEHALFGLLHDASEAYLADVSSPLKRTPIFGQSYKRAESHLMNLICRKFNLPMEEPVSVKAADIRLLNTEQRDLMGPKLFAWDKQDEAPPLPDTIIPWSPENAEKLFLDRFYELSGLTATPEVACSRM